MKTIFLALLAISFSVQAKGDIVISVQTPDFSHTYTGCYIENVRVLRTGTYADLVAMCKTQYTVVQAGWWTPTPGPLEWDSEIVVNSNVNLQCEMIEYARGGNSGLIIFECLD